MNQKLVESVQVQSVDDLYFQYARFAHHYSGDDNPLVGLTRYVPAKARYYAIAPASEINLTYDVMKALAGRRKLRQIAVTKDEINAAVFSPTDHLIIFYA